MYDVAAFRESRRNGDATSRLTQLLHSTLLFDRFDVATWTPIVNDVSGPARICHLRRVMNLLDDEGLTASLSAEAALSILDIGSDPSPSQSPRRLDQNLFTLHRDLEIDHFQPVTSPVSLSFISLTDNLYKPLSR